MEKHREVVFLVRMWKRDGDVAPAEWLGSVHDVASDVRYYVTGPRDVADFIGARLAQRRDGDGET